MKDAHNHLHDARLDLWRDEGLQNLPGSGVEEMVVNGTSEIDWPRVAALAERYPWLRPSFGLHPWRVGMRSENWKNVLRGWLEKYPSAGVGEIGLDRWMKNPMFDEQVDCFRWQMNEAKLLDRPATIHCLRAFGHLIEVLRSVEIPSRGFLLHSYSGPPEMVPEFCRLGAYFSISPDFAWERRAARLETLKLVPPERLLIETDAPDMAPPPDLCVESLEAADGSMLNHPLNLAVSERLAAKVLDLPMIEARTVLSANHDRLFRGCRR